MLCHNDMCVVYRNLRCLRNTIHCHLIVTFILKNVLWLVMAKITNVVAEEYQNVFYQV